MMTRQIRRVAAVMFLLIAAVFVNLNYLQVLRADDLASDERNTRRLIREYDVRRGRVIAGDEVTELARVEDTGGALRFQRQYTNGPLFASVTGYHSLVYGRSELEQSFNDFLTGRAPEAFARTLADLLAGREPTGDDLILTIRPGVQQAARDALGEHRGAVVAIEPRTGYLLALYSNPSYDPSRLASFERSQVISAWEELNADPARPLVNRAVREWYPPGSSFKLVTAAAALEAGTPPETTYPDPVEQELPQTTSTIRNFGRGTCNNGQPISITQAMVVSCNTTFAQIGLQVGAERLIEQAEAFGFNARVLEQLPSPLDSRVPKELDPPQTAQAAIGQFDVRATPLQMALVTAAIANNGVLMTPHLVRVVEDERSQAVTEFAPRPLVPAGRDNAQAISQQTASRLADMMVQVVESGTGQGARIDGVAVGGKTGTAETAAGQPPIVWFTGFAPANDPQVAVAVVIEDGGGVGDEATGGAVAAPVARAVMEAALGAQEAAE